MKKATYTVQQFNCDFPDNTACLYRLFSVRFGNKPCPSCGLVGHYYRQADTSHYVCQCGGHQVSPKAGTIFEKSDTDLYKWFYAIFLFSVSKNGVSSKELERQLGVTYKTAWRIGFQLRSLMEQGGLTLGDTVEADETYVGGQEKNKHSKKRTKGTQGRSTKTKVPVFGLNDRSVVIAKAVPNVRASTVMPLIKSNVRVGSTVVTDTLKSYDKLGEAGYGHESVNHSAGEYAKEGGVHTNSIEGFWGQMKRSIDGTHHFVSPKHLQHYVDQHVWLWNLRACESPLFSELALRAAKSSRH